jgi:dTMP kinase
MDILPHHRRLLAERDFRRWFAAALAAGLGDWLGLFALQVLVVSLTEGGSEVALFGLGGVMLAKLVPSVALGPVAGVVADRLDRRRLLVWSNLLRAALYGGIAVTRDLWLLLLLVAVAEALTVLFIAAKNALLPRMVDEDDLTEANQLTLLVTYGPLPFGAAVAAGLSWLAGVLPRLGLPDVEPVTAALLLVAATFLLAALVLWRLSHALGAPQGDPGDGDAQDRPAGPLAELREGFAHITDRPVIRSLMVGVTGVFFGTGVVIALGPELVRSDLGRPEEDWFGLMTVVGAGLLVGMLVASVGAVRRAKERVFAAVLVPAGALVVVVAFVPTFRWAQALGLVLAVAGGTALVLGFTMLHERTPDALRGRIFAAFYTLARVAVFAALAAAPFLAGALGGDPLAVAGLDLEPSGVRLTIALGGAAAVLGAVPGLVGMLRATRRERS